MTGMNKVILIGNLGTDPEVRTIQSQRWVTTLNLATSETYTVDGGKRTVTQWHRVVLWNNLAEIAGLYLAKGRQIMVEGKLKYRERIDSQGTNQFVTEIHGEKMLMLGAKPESAVEAAEASEKARQPKAKSRRRSKKTS